MQTGDSLCNHLAFHRAPAPCSDPAASRLNFNTRQCWYMPFRLSVCFSPSVSALDQTIIHDREFHGRFWTVHPLVCPMLLLSRNIEKSLSICYDTRHQNCWCVCYKSRICCCLPTIRVVLSLMCWCAVVCCILVTDPSTISSFCWVCYIINYFTLLLAHCYQLRLVADHRSFMRKQGEILKIKTQICRSGCDISLAKWCLFFCS